jgi:Protein of unknown function (DUF3800)
MTGSNRNKSDMLTAYFDDTGTHDHSPLIGFGGLIGNEEQWYLFEASWIEKLSKPLPSKPPLNRFHMTECMAREGEFRGYSEAERDAVIHDFRQLIVASGVYGYAIGVAQRDWNELIEPSHLRGWFGDAEAFCFRDCVSKMVAFTRDISAADKDLSLVFDNRPHRTEINERISKRYQSLPASNGARLHRVSFLDAASIRPLQAADLFAWEFFNHVRAMLQLDDNEAPSRPHARQFFNTGRFFMQYVDRETCLKLLAVEPRTV